MVLQPGQTLGEYRIDRPLGRGGLGAVYQATHLISQRKEALKVLLSEQISTAEMNERFRREIQLLASLKHPNIASLHNAFYFEDQLVMVMELVEGEDLRSRCRRTSIPLDVLLEYASQVLTGLEYAHAHGIVHRDIKPANIMLATDGSVKLLDFGIAIAGQFTDLTMAGSLIGSPSHMSPEQIRGEKATPRADIYSLGVTLYEVIAGQPPFTGATTYELLMAHTHQVPRPLRQLRQAIPVALSDAIAKAMEKDPADRFATAAEFRAALHHEPAPQMTETEVQRPLASWQRISTDELKQPVTSAIPPESLVRHLASFIGPIAKVVVARLAKQTSDLDQLYALAAKQIDDESERQRFLRTRPRP